MSKGNHGKNLPAQTFGEIVEDGQAKRKQSKLYKAESAEFVNDCISALVAKTTSELAEIATAEPVSLSDVEEVQRRTVIYLKGCEAASCMPSMAGLARSMGLARRSLYYCIDHQQPQKTAAWLELCRDSFSDMLAETALRNNCNGIVAIFLQKSIYGLRESLEIVAKQETPLGPILEDDELKKRIEANLADDG